MQLSGTPILILKEGTERSRGKDAQRNNIAAAKIIAEAVRSTLGPRGMDKMLVDSLGDVTITNDGATILDEIEVQHPAAKLMVEISKTQDQEVGDGTTSAVVLAGELLKKAEDLIDQKIHPTTIAAGFKKAATKAQEILNNMATEIDINSDSIKEVVMTSLNSKAIKGFKEKFADIAVKAVQAVKEKRGDDWIVDIEQIQIQKKRGKSISETKMIDGIVIDKEIVHSDMPKSIKNAKIALLNVALEIKKTEFDSEIRITDPTQIQAFLDEEEKILKGFVEKIKDAGASMVFCQKGIDDAAQHYLASAGISAVRRVKKSDMEKLQRATGANIVMNLEDLRDDDLGTADLVEEQKIGDDKMVFITGAKELKAVSIVIRGGVEHVVDEADRGLHDALCVAKDIIQLNKIVGGGGASEIEVAKGLRDYAVKVGGREQLAVEAVADALEVIPKTLAENAGLDPIDILVKLRASHESNGKNMGIDVFDGELKDMVAAGITEPVIVKLQAIKSAVESAAMILRIDDVIAAKASEGPPGGMPPGGMGGMPPGMGGMGGMPPGMM
ncbi:MAG: thermosome subunit beta [Candidatus Helarchaeota archaeon]